MYCQNCGTELKEGAKFCENCGTRVATINEAETKKEVREQETTTTLGILAFVLTFIIPPIGLILGIVDLCHHDGHKKGLAWAAVIINIVFCILIVLAIVMIIPTVLWASEGVM